MPSFKVPCPSCEHQVLITNPSLVGTKVECPKCKYRFKVDESAVQSGKDETKPEKGKKKVEPAKSGSASKKKSSKKLVAAVVGVLAVIILAVVGFAMMGGDSKPKSSGGGFAGGGGPAPVTPGTEEGKGDGTTDPEKVAEIPKKVNPNRPSDRETTNLLPAQTVALYRFDLDKVRQTPLGGLFDKVTLGMFQTSFGFEASDVAVYYHAFVGDGREPFGIIRLKDAWNGEKDLLPKMSLAGAPKSIKNRNLYTIKSNPFVNGVSNACSFSSLFADVYDKLPPRVGKPTEPRPIGICIYDTQHILIGDHVQLEKFLRELDDKGMPKFGSTAQFSDNAMYLSVESKLKRVLKDLGAESSAPPPILCVERLGQGVPSPMLLKTELQPIATAIEPVLSKTEYVAAALNSFTPKNLTMTVRLVMVSESMAVEVAKEHLTPGLTTATLAAMVFLNSPIEFRNYTAGGVNPLGPLGPGGPTFPGGVGGGTGDGERPGSGRPGGGAGTAPPPAPPPIGGGVSGGGSQPPRPPGGQPPGPGYPGQGYPGTGYPGMGTQPGSGFPNDPATGATSHVDLMLTDRDITITIDLSWSDDAFRRLIAPRIIGFMNTVKGKMAVYASDLSYHALSRAVPRMTAATKEFPRGTSDRKLTDSSRLGVRYKPETRVSFFAELLPYMDRAALAVAVDRDLAWFDEANLLAAESWVPELLVPQYPQSAWRATSPHVAQGRVLGGTSYVAISGIGLDSARYDPKTQTKRVGITGYDWGSKLEEVTDGLDKTIYLMQTPPGLQQPWLAGGGATVRGLSETDPMQGFRHSFGTPDNKPGTFALMGDGSIRFIPGDIDPKILLAMATRAGGEDLTDLDKHAPLVSSPKSKDAELKTSDTSPAGKAEVAPEPREPKR